MNTEPYALQDEKWWPWLTPSGSWGALQQLKESQVPLTCKEHTNETITLQRTHWVRSRNLTLRSSAASQIGLNLWFLGSLESRHTKHIRCFSSSQKSLSSEWCRLQTSSLWRLASDKLSHRFFGSRFNEGDASEDIVLQIGHSLNPYISRKSPGSLCSCCGYRSEEQDPWRFCSTLDRTNPLLR